MSNGSEVHIYSFNLETKSRSDQTLVTAHSGTVTCLPSDISPNMTQLVKRALSDCVNQGFDQRDLICTFTFWNRAD